MVDTIGTDHCPFPRALKEAGVENIHDAPFGIPGVETTVRVMLTAVSEGHLSLNQWVRICCERPARLFRLFPRKGAIQVGSDADLIIVDMEREETLRNADIVSKCKWTPFDGMKVKGAPVMTIVRGNVVMEDGVVCGEAGVGKPVSRVRG
jgi:dihydroorotase/allantoinase